MVMELNSDNFQQFVENHDVVLVDFWAPWCAPCLLLTPIIEELEKEMEGVVFAKLNVDDNQEIAREFGIMSIPTLMIFKRGEMADMVVGVMAKDALRERIERHMD
ncbi:MAG: thioredoxin [Thermoplasmata archaeon]|nr:MAG: thioredoxin [Thermoplasmata archaeon]